MSNSVDSAINLSPDAPHRLRRAEDREEVQIRLRVWDVFLEELGHGTTHSALMRSLDSYRAELGVLALKRLGVGGTR